MERREETREREWRRKLRDMQRIRGAKKERYS